MLANMKATGRSADETHAALAQYFLNCPAVDPDAEETEVNVDEFEHTEVEQQARCDQQRVLAALARHRREHRRDPEVQREGNDVTQAAFQSLYAQDGDDATDPTSDYCGPGPDCSGPDAASDYCGPGPEIGGPAHPTQLSDGGGTDVEGVGSQQTQDTGTNSIAPLWMASAGGSPMG